MEITVIDLFSALCADPANPICWSLKLFGFSDKLLRTKSKNMGVIIEAVHRLISASIVIHIITDRLDASLQIALF